MNPTPENDPKLQSLLAEAKPDVSIPPGFREGVWRRVDRQVAVRRRHQWLERTLDWMATPLHAMAGATALVVLGVSIGLLQGTHLAHDLARDRYVSAVSPAQTR